MHLSPRILLESASAAGTLGCLFYYALSLAGLASFLSGARRAAAQALPADEQLPPVSILKPLKGVDPGVWESFCSHAEQQ
jgi:ceramide glucosyltransferase